jgi:hypothetical protein
MIRSSLLRCGMALTAALGACAAARAADGIVITTHYEHEGLGTIHDGGADGRIMRYDLKDDKVVSSRALYDKGAGGVTISPFGDRIVFSKPGGMLAVMSIDGGAETDLVSFVGEDRPAKPATNVPAWPASEGGKWIYYMDGRKEGGNNLMRRVHVETKKDEPVVKLNRQASIVCTLSNDATPHTGHFAKRTDNYVIAIYDMAKGDGDLFNCPRTFGCGESISPDGSLLAANTGDHTAVNLVDMSGQVRQQFRLNQWDGDPVRPELKLAREKIEWAWQSFRWSANSMNWLAVTQGRLKPPSSHSTIYEDAVLYDYIGRRQINVTRNGAGKFDRAWGFWETSAKEVFLGYFSGKAPLTVEISDKRLPGDLAWDYADGSPGSAAAAGAAGPKHTYQKAGFYAMKALAGGKVFQAHVYVQKRLPPRATCHYVDATHLLVEFNEPMQGTPAVTLDGGAKVAEAQLSQTGMRLSVELAEPLKGSDRVRIEGLTDLAQVPNALPNQPLDLAVPAWPSRRDDLVFLWEDARKLNAVYDNQRKSIRELRVSRDRGTAGLDRYGRMRLDKGLVTTGFYSQANAQLEFRELILADAFTLECTIQTAEIKQHGPPAGEVRGYSDKIDPAARVELPTRIVNCSAWYDSDWEFMLGQQDDRLLFSIRTTENMLNCDGKPVKGDLHGRAPIYEIGQFKDTEPHHLAVSYVPGSLVAYWDGKKVFQTDQVKGGLKTWGYGELCFGDNHNGGRHGWQGKLEGVAIYKRAMDEAEALRNAQVYAAKIKARPVLPQMELEAALVATSEVPDAARIAPYREALVVNEYQVKQVRGAAAKWQFPGKTDPGARIRVAQWGLLDGLKTDLTRAKIGDVRRMVLESFDRHPEKLDQLMISDTLEISDQPLLYEPLK